MFELYDISIKAIMFLWFSIHTFMNINDRPSIYKIYTYQYKKYLKNPPSILNRSREIYVTLALLTGTKKDLID